MKVLIDTLVFLWLITGDSRLSAVARHTFLDVDNRIFLSAASLWEISIKMSLGKIVLHEQWFRMIQNEMARNVIQWLPIEMIYCNEVARLPFYHRDPFDRMRVAQAITEDMRLLSRDRGLSDYQIVRIW